MNKSILSQRRADARLGTLLQVATVFEETLGTEERTAAIRAELDISDSMVVDKFELESAFEKRQKSSWNSMKEVRHVQVLNFVG